MGEDICNVCNKGISGRVITALGKKWHPEHFTCDDCKKPISGSTFHEKDGKVYCVDDFTKNHTKKCKACGKPITGTAITAMGETWHDNHFVCKKCDKPIASASFKEKDGKPCCIPCYNKHYAAHCHGCSKVIETKTIIALDKKWHEECFKCIKCEKPIGDSAFAVIDNKPACKSCT